MNWGARARALTVAPPRAIPFLFSFQSHRVILGVSMLHPFGFHFCCWVVGYTPPSYYIEICSVNF